MKNSANKNRAMFDSTNFLIEAKQLYHLELNGGHCELALPDVQLAQHIDFYWLLTIEAPRLDLTVVPDAAVDLVLSPDIDRFAALYFPVSEKFCIPLRGPVRYTGVCFKSAGANFLLGDQLPELRSLNNGADTIEKLHLQELIDKLQTAKSLNNCVDCFNEFWIQRVSKKRHVSRKDPRIDYSKLVRVLQDSIGEANIQALCTSLDISERQFRRISKDLFGLSPKQLQKILRLQAALAELFDCEPRQLNDLYYDDSHRIRELKQLTGLTPGNIRRMAEKYNE